MAVSPVPIAHTGSYATTTLSHSSLFTAPAMEFSCLSMDSPRVVLLPLVQRLSHACDDCQSVLECECDLLGHHVVCGVEELSALAVSEDDPRDAGVPSAERPATSAV